MLNIKNSLLIILISTSSAYAEVVKLTCPISLETRYSEGIVRRENVVATVDVNYKEGNKSITIKTHKILAIVSSISALETVRFVDRSDQGRWELTDVTQLGEVATSTRISIDRNSGVISYESRFKDSTGYENTVGNGNCIKLDPAVRKF